MARFFAAIAFVGSALFAAPALAQPAGEPSPGSPPPAALPPAPPAASPPPIAPPASPLSPPAGEGTGIAPPPSSPPYGYGGPADSGMYGRYGYAPPPGPPPPPMPPPSTCCRWSIRYNPFDLIDRRLSFEAEVAIAGPFAIEIDPSWIFASPTDFVDQKGFELGGRAVFYIFGKPMRGLWLKAHASYERYDATFTNPDTRNTDGKLKASKTLASAVLGGLIGSSWVIGRDGGFTMSGGVGIGIATAPPTSIVAPGDAARSIPEARIDFYDKSDRVRLLGSLSLGATF